MQFSPASVPTFYFLQETRKQNHSHFTHLQDLLKPGASFLQYNEGDTNPVEKIACDNVMRATSVLRSVGEKSTGKVPNIAIFQPFVATVGNSAITECKFLDIGQKKGGKEKAKQVSSALGSFPSFYIAILLAVSPLLLLHPHLIGIHHYYPSLPKASLSVQPPYSSLYAEFP